MQIDEITEKVIGCAIEVHRNLGPGLLDSIYEAALCIEMETAGSSVQRQIMQPVAYKGRVIGEQRIDLLVEGQVVVELKSVERIDPIFEL